MTTRRNTAIGQPLPRVEDARLLRGRGRFIDDFQPQPDGMLHAAILRAQVAHGTLRAIDYTKARALPGIRAVITADDIAPVPVIKPRMAPAEGQERFLQPVIVERKIRYVGEPLAVVVAESRALAEDALDLIAVDVDEIPAMTSMQQPASEQPLLFEEHGTNFCARYVAGIGDAAAAFAQAHYTRREVFKVHRHSASPLETRGLVAEWRRAEGKLTVWGAAKVPFVNRRMLAAMLSLPEHAIELLELDVGGGFGVRGEFYPEDFLIPFAARLLGRPVKWIEDRREHMMATNHSRDVACSLEIACSREGHITGLRGTLSADMGAYIRTTGIVVPSRAAQFLPGPYHIPNVEVEVCALLTNKTPAGSYRGPGRFEANFFRERLMDMAARDLGLDPATFRRLNLIEKSAMPYDAGSLVPYDTPTIFDGGDYRATFERCLSEIGWSAKKELAGRQADGRYHGVGLACFVESGGSGKENARITIDPSGMILVDVGSSALGQGIETSFAQIAADALGVPMEMIQVRHGSTDLLENGFGSYHGRSIVMGGPAVMDAAAKLLDLVRSAAASRLGCAPGDIIMADGRVAGPDGRLLDFRELSPAAAPLTTEGTFASSKRTYSYGTHAAHVAVDPGTGQVEVIDYAGVEDAGRVINPLIVKGQKVGAIVQGLGGVFLEDLAYDDKGQLLVGSFADYLLPTATDFPRVRTATLELAPSPMNPLGAKGAGEDGIISVAAAIGNAVAAALRPLGVEPVELPLSPSRIWQLIQGSARRTDETIEEAS